MSAPPPIYVISLERNRARYEATREAWAAMGYELRYWAGVDATRAIRLEEKETVYWRGLPYISAAGDSWTRCEIACYLSHHRLWRHCLNSDERAERVLIIEDDTEPTAACRALLGELDALPESYAVSYTHLTLPTNREV